MTRFLMRKLPPHWLFVPSKRQLQKVLDRLGADLCVVEFGRTGASESLDRISIGFLEARTVNDRWCFYLRLWGVREALIGPLLKELSVVAADEIEHFIRARLCQPPSADVDPSQFHLVFRAEDGLVRSLSYQRSIGTYSFSTGEWWKERTRVRP